MTYLRKFGKILLWALLAVLLLGLIATLAVRQPGVQTWLVGKVAGSLSERIGTEVRVDRVHFVFFRSLRVDDLFLADQSGDTLLAIGGLQARIGLFSLFRKQLHLQITEVDQLKMYLRREAGQTDLNAQFLLSALAPEDRPAAPPSAGSGISWDLQPGKIRFTDALLSLRDEVGGTDMEVQLGECTLDIARLDLNENLLHFAEVALHRTEIDYRQSASALPPSPDSSTLSFPDLGWRLLIDRIDLAENRLYYDDQRLARQPEVLDPNHLQLDGIGLQARDLVWQPDRIELELLQAALTDHSGLKVERLAGRLLLTPQQIAASELRLQTGGSELQTDLRLDFTALADLPDFLEKVKLESNSLRARLALDELWKCLPTLRTIPELQFLRHDTVQLAGQLLVAGQAIETRSLELEIPRRLALEGDLTLRALDQEPEYQLDLRRLEADYRFLRALGLPAACDRGVLALQGQIEGPLASLNFRDLQLRTLSGTAFRGHGRVLNLPDADQLSYRLQIDELRTSAADLRCWAPAGLPAELDSLGIIRFSGRTNGTTREIELTGLWTTTPGRLSTDLSFSFPQPERPASYEGNFRLIDFDLGRVAAGPDTTLGRASLQATVKGSGLELDELQTELTCQVDSLWLRDYVYHGLLIDGALQGRKFDGQIRFDDPHLAFDLRGRIDLNDERFPEFDLSVRIDTADLYALHLYPDPLALSAAIEADLSGNDLDNLSGFATVQEVFLRSSDALYRSPQAVRLEAQGSTAAERSIRLRSDLLDADLEGVFSLRTLPAALQRFTATHFPIEILGGTPSDSLTEGGSAQEVQLSVRFKKIEALTEVLLPDLTELAPAELQAQYSDSRQQLEVHGIFPRIAYAGNRLDSLRLDIQGNQRQLSGRLALDEVGLSDGSSLDQTLLSSTLRNDSLRFQFRLSDRNEADSVFSKLAFGGLVRASNRRASLHFDPEFYLNGGRWQISPEHRLEWGENDLKINGLQFQRRDQRLVLQSRRTPSPGDLSPIELAFTNFRLTELSELLEGQDLALEGVVNGRILLETPRSSPRIQADIDIDRLRYQQQEIGNLSLEATQFGDRKATSIRVNLSGANRLEAKGSYADQTGLIELRADLQELALATLDPFLEEYLDGSAGTLSGNILVDGPVGKPTVRGSIRLQNVSTLVKLANTRYAVADHTIELDERKIDLGNLKLVDPEDRQASLSGLIRHDHFARPEFDLNFRTDAFQFLHTQAKDNSLYYGDLFLRSTVAIRGPVDRPTIEIDAATLPRSQLTVQPFTEEQMLTQEDYIVFANPADYHPDSLYQIERNISTAPNPFDLTLNLSLTPDARLKIIVDPETGDQLNCSGSANLTILMEPSGELSVSGTYTIETGAYSFNYENLVKREFQIEKGSNIQFPGDPYQARFDITAAYRTRATTYELIKDQATLSAAEVEASKKRSTVGVLLRLSGDLDQPEVSFDLEIPGESAGAVTSAVDQKLRQLRDQPTELNTQVFGLLFFNSFLSAENNTLLTTAGEAAALSSVSRMLSNQLNRLAERYIKGVELSIDVDSYLADYGTASAITEMQVGLSKQLFDERLTLRVGTDINLNNERNATLTEGNFSTIAGDFVLEYKLNPAGNYLLRVFHRSNYNVLDEANTYRTGASILFKKSFNGKRYE